MRPGKISHQAADPADAIDFRCQRFWLPRGTDPDLSDRGFLVDPMSPRLSSTSAAALFEQLSEFPVLALLGEPGMGKTTTLNQEASRLEADARATGDLVLRVDLAGCGTDVFVSHSIFESEEFRSWKEGRGRLQLFLDGFDTCLQYVPTLVALLLNRFAKESRDRLWLRIACRPADWPPALEYRLRN